MSVINVEVQDSSNNINAKSLIQQSWPCDSRYIIIRFLIFVWAKALLFVMCDAKLMTLILYNVDWWLWWYDIFNATEHVDNDPIIIFSNQRLWSSNIMRPWYRWYMIYYKRCKFMNVLCKMAIVWLWKYLWLKTSPFYYHINAFI